MFGLLAQRVKSKFVIITDEIKHFLARVLQIIIDIEEAWYG
jgi:hypothetical protein